MAGRSPRYPGDTITERPPIAGELDRSSDIAAFERSILNGWPRPRQLGAGRRASRAWSTLADLDASSTPVGRSLSTCPPTPTAPTPPWSKPAAPPPVCTTVRGRVGLPAGSGLARRRDPGLAASLPHSGSSSPTALAAGTVADRLEAAGVDVLRTGAAQMGRACADLVDQIAARSIAHRAQAVLDDTLAQAGRRILGDELGVVEHRVDGPPTPISAR